MTRLYMELDDASEFLAFFYHYVSWRCEPQAKTKLQQLLTTLEKLIDSREKLRKLKKLEKEIWRQFADDEIWCQISRKHR